MELQRNLLESISEDWEEQLKSLEKAIENNPDDLIFILKKAYLLFKMGFWDECIELCRSIGESESKKWEFLLLQTACENWIYKRDLALEKIREFAPVPKEDLHRDLGTILSVFCDVSGAIYYLSNLLKQKEDENLWCMLARLYRADGRLREALSCAERSLAISREFRPAIRLKEKIRIEILRGATRTAKTGGYLESVPVQEARAGFSAEDWFVRGLGNIRQKDYNAALKSFAEALKCEPGFYICWYYAGKVQEKLGGESKARQCLKKFIEGFPRSSGFYRETIMKCPPDMERKYKEGLYHRWIGYFPADHQGWMAYIGFLVEVNDRETVKLISSAILHSYLKEWFIDISSPQYSGAKGLLELFLRRIQSARESFNSALKSQTPDSIVLLGMGKSYEYSGNFKEAQEYYRKLAAVKGSQVLGLYQLANLNLLKKDEKEAITIIDEALKNMSDSVLLKGKRAEILLEFSDLKGFMEYFTSIVNKEYLDVHLNLMKSLALYKAGKFDEAIWEMEALKTRSPGNSLILKSLGALYINTERYNKVEEIVEELKKSNDFEAEIFLMQGLSYYHLKQYDQALQFLESYLNLCPLDSTVWTYLALARYDTGNHGIPELSFAKAKELSGGCDYTWLNLAILYSNEGKHQKAHLCLSQISDKEPMGILYHLCNAISLRELGRIDEAECSVNDAVKIEPDNRYAVILRGLIKFDKKEFSESYDAFIRATAVHPDMAELWYAKGVVDLHMNNSNAALESINYAIEKKPDLYEAWLAKAVLYWSLSDLREAGDALKGAQNLRPDEFGEWLRYASSQKDHLSAIKLEVRIKIPFHVPLTVPIGVEDPISIFKCDRQDDLFK